MSKSKAKDDLAKLVSDFEEHFENYKRPSYKESPLRNDFLNKFFKILGWDVTNDSNLPPSYREVIIEDDVEVEGRAKHPDYSFRIPSGEKLFFAEAKKPSVDITTAKEPAFQLRRYGYNAELSISILTNFENFALYDCTFRPDQKDLPKRGQLKIIHYKDYVKQFDYLWNTFSKESVLKGSLKQFAPTKRSRKGTASLDKDFLASLDDWRILLAKDINENNSLDEYQINQAVQQIIDRIIFLRIAEDRKVENYGIVSKATESEFCYKYLLSLFIISDNKYNSGLFKNNISDQLNISNEVLTKIIKGLYYPESPYEFSVMPIEILGKAYEQFLGKKIDLTSGGNIKIDSKPEVRKAGGVYYTPRYIVEYIVKNTVGKICEGKTPEEVAKLTFLDPACGSGSFLVYTYEYLLNWHRDFFAKNKISKKKAKEVISPSGELTTKFKGQILLNNIYGTDIDSNAVEVTKLSLLLKCMEGETKDSVSAQIDIFQERLLPTLDNNIKCGNTLIDFDIYSQFPDIGDDIKIRRKINAFNWRNGFKNVFNNGGFDVVLGNPPYIFTRDFFENIEKEYYSYKYKDSWEKQNSYLLFMEKSLHLAKKDKNGLISFIVPNSWLTIESGKLIRKRIIPSLELLIDLNYQVFEDASMEPSIFVINNSCKTQYSTVATIRSNTDLLYPKFIQQNKTEWTSNQNRITAQTDSHASNIIKTILKNSESLEKYFQTFSGLQAYEKGKGTPAQTAQDVKNRIYDYNKKYDKDTYCYLNGSDVERYNIVWSKTYLQWGKWLSQPRKFEIFQRPRVLIREITGKFPQSIIAAFTSKTFLNNKSILNVLHKNNDVDSLKCLESILNSKLVSFYYKKQGVKSSRKLFPKVVIKNLREFPYPKKIPTETRQKILKINSLLRTSYTSTGSSLTQRALNEISSYDDELNQLVYGLYGLNQKEIDIIESEEN